MMDKDNTKYQRPRGTKREGRTRTGRFRAGVLAPVMAVGVRGNESGILTQSIAMELDPILGRMVTSMYAEIVSVFTPVQAIDAIKDPANAYAGMTDVIRNKLRTGAPLFNLEPEGEISRRCKVNPRSVGGVKMVGEHVRLAHNCAVNYLRTRKYDKAAKLLHTNAAVTPAIVTRTVLELLNGVLDPDERINGEVNLQFPNVSLPVEGLFFEGNMTQDSGIFREGGNSASGTAVVAGVAGADGLRIKYKPGPGGSAMNQVVADVTARLNGTSGTVSVDDFYNAETTDRLIREMRAILEEYPEYGEEMIVNWAHGLNVQEGQIPWVINEQRKEIGRDIVSATDSAGVDADKMRTDSATMLSFTVPIPKTELGGVIITFAVLKPEEGLAAQPHPILSDVWGAENFVADEMKIDPVPVTIRELDSNCTVGQEATIAFYIGNNGLKQTYVDFGLSRQLNPATIGGKTAVWQLELPLSVTPQNILYPASLPQTPFADPAAEVVTYTVSSTFKIATPTIFGPTPVEQMAIIDTATLLT